MRRSEIVRELELCVEAGRGNVTDGRHRFARALASVAESTGSITVGEKSDVALVDGEPFKRIGDLRRPFD